VTITKEVATHDLTVIRATLTPEGKAIQSFKTGELLTTIIRRSHCSYR